MNHFFQWIVSASQNFYDKRLLSWAAIHLLFLDISSTKTSVGDPILKLKLSEQTLVYDPKLRDSMFLVIQCCSLEIFAIKKY